MCKRGVKGLTENNGGGDLKSYLKCVNQCKHKERRQCMPVGRSVNKVRKRDQELSGRIYEALGSDLAAALCSPQKQATY